MASLNDLIPNREEAVMAEFAARRKRQYIVGAAAFLVIICGVLVRTGLLGEMPLGFEKDSFAIVFFPVIALALGFSLWNWRCPACRKYLGRAVTMHFCPKCGVRFTREG